MTLPALVLATAGFLWPASAGAMADVCRDQFGQPAPWFEWTAWLADLERNNGGGLKRHTMTEGERVRFLSAYNNTPPVTDRNPERIEIFSRRGHPLVVVVFVEDGCVTVTALMLRALVEGVISSGGRPTLQPAEQEV